MNDIPILLLAAGQSSRMRGIDKLTQTIGGKPLLRRSAEAALAAGPVIVTLPPSPHPRYQALAGLDVLKIPVPDANEGINASLRTGLAQLPPDSRAAMILLADLPDLTAAYLQAVLNSVGSHPDNLIWRGTTAQGKPGHPVVFHHSLFDALRSLKGDNGAQAVVKAHTGKVHLHPLPDRHALYDLDTPEDWAAWRAAQTPCPK